MAIGDRGDRGDRGPRPSRIPGHRRSHLRASNQDTRWVPACQCGWTFYSSVRSLRIADRTYRYHLDRVYASRAGRAPTPW